MREQVAFLAQRKAAGVDMVKLRALFGTYTPEQLGAILDHTRTGSSAG